MRSTLPDAPLCNGRLFTEHDLCRRFGVSRMTVRQAINALVDEGLLYRVRGVGTLCTAAKVTESLERVRDHFEDWEAEGRSVALKILDFRSVEAGSDVARRLKLPERTEVLHLLRLWLVDGAPIGLVYFYIHPKVAPLLSVADVEQSHVRAALAKRLRLPFLGEQVEIEAGQASHITASHLKIRTGDPVLIRRLTQLYGDGQPLVAEACAALGVPVLTSEGFVADDVLGTFALKGAAAGCDVAIVTGDKDFFQLVGGRIRVFNPRDEGTWYDSAGVAEKFGVTPDKVVDVLALTGDAVDNVKGVPGIGEKGARDLIAQYGSLDALLEGAATVQQKRYREALLANADAARASCELVTIRPDVPVDRDLESLRYRGPDQAACYALFSSLGFRTFTSDFAPTPATVSTDYAIVESLDSLAAQVTKARWAGRIGLRVLGDDANAMRAGRVGIVFSRGERQARYVPLGPRALDEVANPVASGHAALFQGSPWEPRAGYRHPP